MRAMKDSGIEWIGEIPQDWQVVAIKQLFSIIRGRVIAKSEVAEEGLYPIYSSQTKNDGCMGYIDGTAIIPTRVRAPKDKATVEGIVGIVSTCILAAVRNEKFFSLYELNAAIRERLNAFNFKPFQKKDGSRFTLFSEERN